MGSSVFLLKTFLVYHYYIFIHFVFICRSVGQHDLRPGKINLFCHVIFSDELDSY